MPKYKCLFAVQSGFYESSCAKNRKIPYMHGGCALRGIEVKNCVQRVAVQVKKKRNVIRKTKKELMKDIKLLMRIIRFYTDEEVTTMADAHEHLEEIRKHDGPTKK